MEITQRYLGTVVCLDVTGRLVVGEKGGLLKERVNSLLFEGHRDILLNLKEVSQIDTSGLAAIISIRLAADRQGAIIKLVNLPRRVHDLLVITKLLTVFEVFESEAEAVTSFGSPAGV